MLITTVLIAISLLVFCASENNETDIESQQNFYCEIQEKRCNNLPHPLCSTFNATDLESENLELIKFSELSSNDIDFVVNTINKFRNDLAIGKVYRYPNHASKLRLVQWSPNFVRLLHHDLQYSNQVCTDISIDHRFKLYKETFQNTEENNTFYRHAFQHRVLNETKRNCPPWVEIYREEFDRIGCIYFEDNDYLINYFVCYTNGYRLNEGEKEADMSKMYKSGEPCTECDEGGCSAKWPNLCDPNVPKAVRVSAVNSAPPIISNGDSNYQINIICLSFCIWSATLSGLVLDHFY